MSYPVFLLVGISVAVAIAVALAGPLSFLSIIGFWVANYFFLEWRHKSAPLESMSNFELHDVLDWWIGHGPFGRNTSDLSRIRSKSSEDELRISLKRIIDIYNEKIKRAKNFTLDTSDYENARNHLANELEKLSKEIL